MIPKISIIIPLYNKEHSIRRAISSILVQSVQDFEIIVVNDGSTDMSLDVVNNINDERITIIDQPNTGVSSARNRGIAFARGKYIVFLDADDIFSPSAFDIIDERIKADVIVGDFIQTDGRGKVVRTLNNRISGIVTNNYKSYWRREIYFRMGNMFISNEFLKSVDGFKVDLSVYEDLEWILRILDKSSVYVSKQKTVVYERGLAGLSRGLKSIDSDYAKIVSIASVSDKFKRYIIGDFLFRRFIIRLLKRDWDGVRVIWQNNTWRLFSCFFFCVIGYTRDRLYQY